MTMAENDAEEPLHVQSILQWGHAQRKKIVLCLVCSMLLIYAVFQSQLSSFELMPNVVRLPTFNENATTVTDLLTQALITSVEISEVAGKISRYQEELKRITKVLQNPIVQNMMTVQQLGANLTFHPPTDIDWKTLWRNSSNPRLCVTSMGGGLGNCMFQYAVLYGLARRFNMTPIINEKNLVFSAFDVSAFPIEDNTMCQTYHWHGEKRSCSYSNQTVTFDPTVNERIHGFLQSWVYFGGYLTDVLREFTFKQSILDRAVSLLAGAVSSKLSSEIRHPRTFIGIHMRIGDILETSNYIEYGYLSPKKTYYDNAMSYFRTRYKNTLFIVATDRHDKAQHMLSPLPVDVVLLPNNSPAALDLAALSLCNHTIMSVGSYGWWAGFLANGETIYYAHPARKGSGVSNQFSQHMLDYYLPDWIRME